MPILSKSNGNDRSSTTNDTGGEDRFFAIYGGSGSHTPMGRAHRTTVTLKSNTAVERQLYMLQSGVYQMTAGCSVADIFYPYKSEISSVTMPGFSANAASSGLRSASGIVTIGDCLPFDWDQNDSLNIYDRNVMPSGDGLSYLVSSETYYRSSDRYRDKLNVRSVGLRLPAMAVGWGYTTFGQPWPNANSAGTSGLFKGGYIDGRNVDPNDYIAAPIDMRYDVKRNVWTSPQELILYPCNLVNDGGSSGNKTTACSLTYTVKNIFNEILIKNISGIQATGMSPIWARTALGYYTAAKHGTYYRDGNYTMMLYQVDEVPNVSGC